uniref:hypothetical protein n=1 Tax=Kitasatospora purpeofusca TaxID=67352 RepID=UPI0036D29AC6
NGHGGVPVIRTKKFRCVPGISGGGFLLKNPPFRGWIFGLRFGFRFWVLKNRLEQAILCDFGGAKIGFFLILILYRNTKIFKNGLRPLSVKALDLF